MKTPLIRIMDPKKSQNPECTKLTIPDDTELWVMKDLYPTFPYRPTNGVPLNKTSRSTLAGKLLLILFVLTAVVCIISLSVFISRWISGDLETVNSGKIIATSENITSDDIYNNDNVVTNIYDEGKMDVLIDSENNELNIDDTDLQDGSEDQQLNTDEADLYKSYYSDFQEVSGSQTLDTDDSDLQGSGSHNLDTDYYDRLEGSGNQFIANSENIPDNVMYKFSEGANTRGVIIRV